MDKIKYYVDKLLKEYPSGEDFFDKLDEIIRLPKNIDIIESLFNTIYKENNNKLNVVVSGKFGEWVQFLVKKNILNVKGNLILVKGSLRLRGTNLNKLSFDKDIDVIYQKHSIEDQNFIFIDDSLYSGSTKKAINSWLKKHNSKIVKTYVIYDGHDKKYDNLKSLYRYYDYHTGKILPVLKLFEILDKIKKEIPFDYNIIIDKISKGEIRTTREMFKFIKNVSDKIGYDFDFSKLYTMKQYEKVNELNEYEEFEVPIVLFNIREYYKIKEIIDEYDIGYQYSDDDWVVRNLNNDKPMVIFFDINNHRFWEPIEYKSILNPDWYKQGGFENVWRTILTIKHINHLKRILDKGKIIPLPPEKPSYKPMGDFKRIGESTYYNEKIVSVYCSSRKDAVEFEQFIQKFDYSWDGKKDIIKNFSVFDFDDVTYNINTFEKIISGTFTIPSLQDLSIYKYPDNKNEIYNKLNIAPSYKPKKITKSYKNINESKFSEKYIHVYSDNRKDSIKFEEFLFENGFVYQYSGIDYLVKNTHYAHSVLFDINLETKFIVAYSRKEKRDNYYYFPEEIKKIKFLLKYGKNTPSYKPKEIKRTYESVQNYPYKEIVVKVENIDELLELEKQLNNIVQNNIYLSLGIRYIGFPNYVFIGTKIDKISNKIDTCFMSNSAPTDEQINDFVYDDSNVNNNIFTINDIDIIKNILLYDTEDIKPTYKPKEIKRTYESLGSDHYYKIKTEEELKDEFGENWKDRISYLYWWSSPYMDYLFGEELTWVDDNYIKQNTIEIKQNTIEENDKYIGIYIPSNHPLENWFICLDILKKVTIRPSYKPKEIKRTYEIKSFKKFGN